VPIVHGFIVNVENRKGGTAVIGSRTPRRLRRSFVEAFITVDITAGWSWVR